MPDKKLPLDALGLLKRSQKTALCILCLMVLALFSLHGLWGAVRHAVGSPPEQKATRGMPAMFEAQGHR